MAGFAYSDEIVARFPTIRGGVLHATGLTNEPAPDPLTAEYLAQQQATIERIGKTPLAEIPSIAAWRRVFSAFGVKPTQYRNAAEALLRRLTKRGDIPSINLLVDVANLVSIRYALPVAVFDQREITGTTEVRFADGSERFNDLGSDGAEVHPDEGEVIFVDDAGLVSARRWCWRQSAQSAARPKTTEAIITVEGHHENATVDVQAAVTDLAELLGRYNPDARVEILEPRH
jgi:DNA/RNA-binding domain of Phe-tRNA-synthetase-like protein